MNIDNLKEILEQHKLWLKDNKTGKRADLRGANLRGADLRRANLPFYISPQTKFFDQETER